MATTITRRSSRRTVEDEHEPPQLQVQAIQQRFVGSSSHSPRVRRPAPVATQTQTQMQTETTRASNQNIAHQQQQQQQQHGNRNRMKRPLELVDGNHDHTPSKRNRIAVEILSRSIPSPILPPRPIVARPHPPPTLYPTQPPLPLSATVATPQQQHQQQQHQQHQHQHQQHQQHQPHHHHSPPAPPPPPSTTTTTEPRSAAPGPALGAATATADQPAPSKTASTKEAPAQATTITPRTKNHRDKVLNGIKHELDRLQPSAVDAGQAGEEGGRRKLRSQEATRFKSELSAYFPDYDEVIGNDVKEQHVLNVDTPIVVVDSLPPSPVQQQQQHLPQPVRTLPPRHATAAAATSHASSSHSYSHSHSHSHAHRPPTTRIDHYPVKLYSDALFHDIYCSEQIGLTPLPLPAGGPEADKEEPVDPLSDAYYAPAHRRAERLEKSIRNTERGRAQHERDQIVRLLNDLQGHDWLRTMGVNGVTESRKKTFEPARDYFVKGCQGILDKFRHWIQEEKRLKLERERAAAERAAEEDDSDDSEASQDSSEEGDSEDAGTSEMESDSEEEADNDEEMVDVDVADDDGDGLSDGDPPDTSDVDASIAKQLHDESLARAGGAAPGASKRLRGMPTSALPELYLPPREFVSFFEKRHQRDASLGKHRRAGRSVMAWGHGIPELEDEVFDLPEEYRDEEFMKVRERKKRLDRREKRR